MGAVSACGVEAVLWKPAKCVFSQFMGHDDDIIVGRRSFGGRESERS